MARRHPKLFTAYHEAGHAVMAHSLGAEIDHVTIRGSRSAGTQGHCQLTEDGALAGAAFALYVLAGMAAETQARRAPGVRPVRGPGSLDTVVGGWSDLEQVRTELARTSGMAEEAVEPTVWSFFSVAMWWIDDLWPAVNAVVEALFEAETRTLDGSEVARAVNTAWRRDEQAS